MEESTQYSKRARKLSDKATNADSGSSAKRARPNTGDGYVVYKKTGGTHGFRGGSITIAPPVQHVVESRLLPSVALSLYDKAPQLKLCEDQLQCFGCEGGYRMVRATHGVHKGSYFYEVEILPTECQDTHFRIGWSTRQGELQAPVGYDQHSFAYRSVEGSRVHKSVRIDDYGDSYGPGDIVGCLIHLDEQSSLNRISFFKNGVDQGIAFSGDEIPEGVYYPAISIYNQGSVRANFGPCFIEKYEIVANPVSELQPMNSDDRLRHEKHIQSIKRAREESKR